MNVEGFVASRRPAWDELGSLLQRAGTHPERLGARDVRRLGARYREAAADLALARQRYPHNTVVVFLADLVGRARHVVYDAGPRRETVTHFVTTGYWRRVAERPGLLLAAWGLLVGSLALGALWAVTDAGGAAGLVPEAFRAVTEPRPPGDLGISVADQTAFSSSIFTNNIRVTILTFAGGVVAGLGTAATVLYNGLLIGVLGGLAVQSGNGERFFSLVVPHGVLELSCIAVAAAAGLRLGAAIVAPGRARRGVVVVAEAREAVLVVVGTAGWLVVAGIVEGFVTPKGLDLPAAVAVGAALGGAYWALVVLRGVPAVRRSRGTSAAGTPARTPR